MIENRASREPTPTDRQTVKGLFYTMPLFERGKPLMTEMIWCLNDCPEVDQHSKLLPNYCYHIFAVFRKTCFKAFPALSETVLVKDQAGLASAKTIEETKKVLQLDWKNLGKVFSIAARCQRFAELEATCSEDGEDFVGGNPDKVKELFTLVLGRQWVAENQMRIATEMVDALALEILNSHLAPWLVTVQGLEPQFKELSYQWGSEAMDEFNKGNAEEFTGFLDVNGHLTGESVRAGIYGFLLLVWPEIQEMIEANPRKTLTDLHEWMQPYMRVGICPYVDIDALRDVCAPPPSGIGLSLRLLKKLPPSPSA